MTEPERTNLGVALRAQEDRLLPCVHCGFCLPACPTYVRLGDENDSPRGRLHLMRAVVEGRLDAGSDAFQMHIDRCLGCRACEPVCPSGVQYGILLESAREAAYNARKPPVLVRLLLGVFSREPWLRWSMALAKLVRSLGIAGVMARFLPKGPFLHPVKFGFAMLAASKGVAFPKVRGTLPAKIVTDPQEIGAEPLPRKRVGLLAGCVQAGLFNQVNAATERILRVNRLEVVKVVGQGCCGALHTHAGNVERARELARRNIDAFTATDVDFIAVNAAGCGAAMKEYGHLLASDSAYKGLAHQIADKTRDVSEVLVNGGGGPRVGVPLPLSVTYDSACHLCHAQKLIDEPRVLLDAIPELDLIPLPGEEECCGGAGIYGMAHADLGGQIGSDKVAAVVGTGADVVATANPGCIMQIGGGLLLAGSGVKARHPIELLDESYRRAGFYDQV
ncbi:MAG: heterodisulfide reductase-related iron-sulfur binding cluster [Gemmatimonadota bacterium]|nr:heterodisulfide reductase-related iron-sulfur binding cluster [Gemmatimonadota bacterium]